MLQCDTIKVQHATWLRLPLQHPAIPFTPLQHTTPLCTHLGPIKLLGFVFRHNALQYSKTRCMTATHFNSLHALELHPATRFHPPSPKKHQNTLQPSKTTYMTTTHFNSLHPRELGVCCATHSTHLWGVCCATHSTHLSFTRPLGFVPRCNTLHHPAPHRTPPWTTLHLIAPHCISLHHTAQTSGSSIHWVSSPVAAPIRTPRKFSSSLDLPFFGLSNYRFFLKRGNGWDLGFAIRATSELGRNRKFWISQAIFMALVRGMGTSKENFSLVLFVIVLSRYIYCLFRSTVSGRCSTWVCVCVCVFVLKCFCT